MSEKPNHPTELTEQEKAMIADEVKKIRAIIYAAAHDGRQPEEIATEVRQAFASALAKVVLTRALKTVTTLVRAHGAVPVAATTPRVGDLYVLMEGGAVRVDAVNADTDTVTLTTFLHGEPTNQSFTMPLSEWPHLARLVEEAN